MRNLCYRRQGNHALYGKFQIDTEHTVRRPTITIRSIICQKMRGAQQSRGLKTAVGVCGATEAEEKHFKTRIIETPQWSFCSILDYGLLQGEAIDCSGSTDASSI